jgi:hypothetical protein
VSVENPIPQAMLICNLTIIKRKGELQVHKHNQKCSKNNNKRKTSFQQRPMAAS